MATDFDEALALSDETAPVVNSMEDLYSDDEELRTELRSRDFPKTQEGRILLHTYRALVFEKRAHEERLKVEEIERCDDPFFQKQRQAEKIKQQLRELERDL